MAHSWAVKSVALFTFLRELGIIPDNAFALVLRLELDFTELLVECADGMDYVGPDDPVVGYKARSAQTSIMAYRGPALRSVEWLEQVGLPPHSKSIEIVARLYPHEPVMITSVSYGSKRLLTNVCPPLMELRRI